MFNQVGPLELVIVLAIVLLIFGPKRLPSLGRQLGRGMREFKDSITGRDDEDEPKPSLTAAAEHPVVARPDGSGAQEAARPAETASTAQPAEPSPAAQPAEPSPAAQPAEPTAAPRPAEPAPDSRR